MFYFRQILPCQFLFKIFTIQSILSLPITSSQKICIRQEKKKTPRKVFKKGKRSFPGTNQTYKKKSLSRARRECLKVCFDQLFDPLLDGLYPENAHEKSLAPSTNGVWLAPPYQQQHFISKLKIYAIYNPSNSIVKLSKVFLSKQTTQKSYLRTLWNAFCRRNLVWCVLSSSVGKEAWLRSKDTFDIILNHSAVQKPFYFTEKHLTSPMLKR